MGDSDMETLGNVTACDWSFDFKEFDQITDQAKDFISKSLVADPKKRMTSEESRKHAWLQVGHDCFCMQHLFDQRLKNLFVLSVQMRMNSNNFTPFSCYSNSMERMMWFCIGSACAISMHACDDPVLVPLQDWLKDC
jgi:serine/threonine protein kinase